MAINHSDKIWLILSDKIMYGSPEDLMIENAFDHIFDTSSLKFNSENGTFSLKNSDNQFMYIEGKGKLRFWTEKAINRIGYSISESITNPYIKIPQDKKPCWQLVSNNSVNEFISIYELIRWIERGNKQFI
jgi:iron complex transport system ATP-binding protein